MSALASSALCSFAGPFMNLLSGRPLLLEARASLASAASHLSFGRGRRGTNGGRPSLRRNRPISTKPIVARFDPASHDPVTLAQSSEDRHEDGEQEVLLGETVPDPGIPPRIGKTGG